MTRCFLSIFMTWIELWKDREKDSINSIKAPTKKHVSQCQKLEAPATNAGYLPHPFFIEEQTKRTFKTKLFSEFILCYKVL